MRRRVMAAAVVAAVLVLTACEVDVGVGVVMEQDGSGRVEVSATLDAEAAAGAPDLADQLAVDDLTAAGWEVSGPDPAPGDGVVVRAVHEFADPAEATALLREVTGEEGPFGDVVISRRSTFVRATTSVTGSVDLSGGLEAFGDDELRRLLGGTSFGVDPATLEDVVALELSATFPGAADAGPGARLQGPRRVVWEPPLGEVTVLRASSSTLHRSRLAWAAGALLSGLAFAGVVAFRVRRWRRDRRSA